MSRLAAGIVAAMLTLSFVCLDRAHADSVADFYKSHDLTLLIGTSSGGGYDLTGRFIARHLAEHLPGNPRVIIQNMPGAGGIVAANYLKTDAPKDGSLIAALLDNIAFEPMFGTKQALYDPTKFNWVGSTNPETAFLAVWHTVRVNSLQDAQTHEITVGTSGVESAPSFFARLLNETLHTKLKIIPGYPGSNEAFLAMERGELDGYANVFTSVLTLMKPDWIREKKVKLLVQYGPEPAQGFSQVPYALDVITDPKDKALMQLASALLAMGRPYVLPPGVPSERVSAIRKAFAETIRDPEVIAEAKKTGIELDRGQSGDQLQNVVVRAYETPPAVIERLKILKANR